VANYRAGDVIRLTRNAIGMTQEQLCEEICSVETLSRIENNKQGIGKDVYERLMAKMERNPLRSYAICSSMDMRIAEEKQALEDAVALVDFDTAEAYLESMKKKMPQTNYNKQYMARFEAIIAYNKKLIDECELVSKLEETIKITVPNYEEYLSSSKIFPFSEQEIFVMMSLSNAYARNGKEEKSIQLFDMILRNLAESYMDEKSANKLRLVIFANKIKVLGGVKKYEEASELAKDALNEAIRCDYGHVYSNLLVSIVWNNEMIKDNLRQYDAQEEIKKLRQAYYIAAARNEKSNMDMIKQVFQNLFQNQ